MIDLIFKQEKVKGDDHDHEPEPDSYDVKKIYWDADGNLRHGLTLHLLV